MATIDLNSLDPTALAQAEDFLVTSLLEVYPSMDLSEGRVLRDLLIKPAAMFYVLNNTNMDALRQSMSMLAIQQNPELATDEIVNAVLSNYRITRLPGSTATGQVMVVIQNMLTTAVQANTVFTIGALTYKTTNAFVGVTTAEAAALDPTTQRQIFPRVDGTYGFLVDVASTAVGVQYNIRRNTKFDAVTPSPASLVYAYAYQDFLGGSNAQSNADLVALFEQSLSPQVFSGRIHIQSLITAKYPNTVAQSIIGFGDEEMLRDRHNIFAISQGGKADIYVRTAAYPVSAPYPLTATLVNASTGLWQVAVDRELVPGFYKIEGILPVDATQDQNSLEIVSEVRGLNLLPDTNEFVPDIQTTIEGAYSRYQTAVVQFIDTNIPTDSSTTRVYNVYIQGMPNVRDIQNLANDRGSRNPQADYLVKAAVPAYCSLSIEVQYTDAIAAPDSGTIKQAIVDAVNKVNYSLGKLPASLIHDAIHNVVGTTGVMVSSPIDMYCTILAASGREIQLRSPNALVIPDLPAEGVTPRTVVFMTSLNNIDLAITKVSMLPV
jgi:hypothetical protein